MTGLKSKFFINVGGALIGIVITLATVPLYISHIGESRYGILSLVWIMLGYLGFLDFGLSRATANSLAKMGDAPAKERSGVFMTALFINAALGSLGGLVIYFGGGYILTTTHDLAPALRQEIQSVMPYIGPMLPLALLSGVGIGALEARERFLIANVLQISSNALGQIIPLMAAMWISPSLTVVIPTILIVRVISALLILSIVIVSEGLYYIGRLEKGRVKSLLGYGVWVTLTNLISPLMTSIDQFVIARMIGAPFVARYSVPMSIASRLQIFNSALARTVFPRFSRLERDEAAKLAAQSVVSLGYLSAMLFAPALVVLHPFFTLWMGPAFSVYSIPVATALFMGAWVNGLAFIPYSLLQAQGRPDTVAKLHTAEVLPYLVTLWLLVHSMGLPGAAVAWALRVMVDCVVLMILGRLPLKDLMPAAPAFIGVILGMVIGMYMDGLPLIMVIAIGSVLALCIGAAGFFIEPRLRELAMLTLNRLMRRTVEKQPL